MMIELGLDKDKLLPFEEGSRMKISCLKMTFVFLGLAHFLNMQIARAEELAAPLKDAEIMNILVNLNNSEILTGRIAKQKTSSEEVRAFADKMIDQHSQANVELQKLKRLIKIETESTALSEDLKKSAVEHVKALKNAQSQLIDSSYMDEQVANLKGALKILEEVLIPKAKSPKLLRLLNDFKESVRRQFDEATQLQDSVKHLPKSS